MIAEEEPSLVFPSRSFALVLLKGTTFAAASCKGVILPDSRLRRPRFGVAGDVAVVSWSWTGSS